jgi:hypothetical protein
MLTGCINKKRAEIIKFIGIVSSDLLDIKEPLLPIYDNKQYCNCLVEKRCLHIL